LLALLIGEPVEMKIDAVIIRKDRHVELAVIAIPVAADPGERVLEVRERLLDAARAGSVEHADDVGGSHS